MNLNAYDELNNIDKTKPWYSPRFKRLYIKGNIIANKRFYKFVKRANVKYNEYEYYLVLTNDYHLDNIKIIRKDDYGRLVINVPTDVINDSHFKVLTNDENIIFELIDSQFDGDVYLLMI